MKLSYFLWFSSFIWCSDLSFLWWSCESLDKLDFYVLIRCSVLYIRYNFTSCWRESSLFEKVDSNFFKISPRPSILLTIYYGPAPPELRRSRLSVTAMDWLLEGVLIERSSIEPFYYVYISFFTKFLSIGRLFCKL